MANFEIAHEKTSVIEGGYVNDPDDNGKETYRGISRKFFPDWKGWGLIDQYKENTTLKYNQYINNVELDDMVEYFYKRYFWDVNKLDDIIFQDIAEELFDTGVNMGVRTAAKFLQKSINLLNRDQKNYENISVDGVIGPKTLTLINNSKDFKSLLKTMNGFQFMKYVNICLNNPSQEKFFRGWLKRVW